MNERKILEKSIEEHQAAIDTAKDKLAKLDKPKLRHGDYGLCTVQGDLCGFFYDATMLCVGELYLITIGDNPTHKGFYKTTHAKNINIVGNFDDLERNSKDLREFKADVHTYKFDFKKCPHAPIYIAGNWHPMNEAVEIHQKLGQLIATAKRDK